MDFHADFYTGLDSALAAIAAANAITICSQEPTTRTEAVTTYMLASNALTPGHGNGDFTIGDGDVSGRKLALAEQTGFTVTNSGNGWWLALSDGTKLLQRNRMAAVKDGTAQAGGADTITLAAGHVTIDNEFAGRIVEIMSGTGSGQFRVVLSSVATTDVVTVSAAWSVNPDATSVYRIAGQLYTAGNPVRIPTFDLELRKPIEA